MEFRELWNRFIETIGLGRKSPFVQDWLDRTNLRIGIPMSIYTMIASRYMYSKTVILWHLVTRETYNMLFLVLAVCCFQLLVVSILYLTKKFRNHTVAVCSIYIYVIGCCLAGQMIAVYDYAIGKQAFVFLPMVAWIFALLLINPISSIFFALVSFYWIPTITNNKIIMSNYVNQVLMLFAAMLVVISIVRWVAQVRSARAEEEVSLMNQKLSEISLKDELTGLKNRYALRQDYERYKNKKILTSMCDIDDFKFYNDTYGHDVGDLVLKHMANTLSEFFGHDNVYRFGGDEYLLILENIEGEEFERRFRSWKEKFSRYVYEGNTLHLSSTCGYCTGKDVETEDLRQMISQADQKLYEGKMTEKGTVNGSEYDPGHGVDQEKMEELSNNLRSGQFDSVTRLPNLSYFRSRADLSIDILRSSGQNPVLAYLNLKYFSAYNRKYGYEAGDSLLRKFGEILTELFPGDLVCRFTDDHFAVITTEKGLLEKIQNAGVRLTGISSGSKLEVRAGLYVLNDGKMDVTAACDCARQAMMLATEREICRWYDDELKEEQQKRQYISDQFEHAIEAGWIEVIYQPIIRTITRKVAGMEVLSRWNDPVYGILGPDDYIPVLESNGLIRLHDLYILHTALHNFTKIQKAGVTVVPFVINLSRENFEDDFFADDILELTRDLDHSLMNIDVTAKALANADSQMESALNRLIAEGFQVWMDGFGSGNSTVDILYRFGLHGIKIDIRSLHEIGKKNNQSIMLRHIISMCKEMNISTLALGVENEKETKFLEETGCEYMQGFYLCPGKTFEEACAEDFRNTFEFEPIESADYFQQISHVNLSHPTEVGSNKQLEALSASIPAAICEIRGKTIRTLRSNASFRAFLPMIGIPDIETFDKVMNQEGTPAYEKLHQIAAKTRVSGKWISALVGGENHECTASFHRIAIDPKDEALAVIGVILDMNTIQNWQDK